ncbi:MAG TPA: hypothetical protein DD381_14105 [Lentisphaeria bacterium]|nr:MAG: hypothetical protein A2X47_01160 [Lentisphaerae bacterium GWF2_38_69]HBM17457.1 hypothetical protein [Lentisphaeria bacterium]
MKIGFTGITLQEGKLKYIDQNLIALEKKDKPKKVSPYFVEFIKDEFTHADVIVVPSDKILDILILDMEKIETRLTRTNDTKEKELLAQCQTSLEQEIPLCDMNFTEEELAFLQLSALISVKPILKVNNEEDPNAIITKAFDKAGYTFFYTTGPKESHAWIIKKDSDIVICAGKIHTDLARGFIRADIVSFEDYLKCHNFNDCKAKGLVRAVNRDYKIQPFEIIEIMFSV